MKKQRSVAQKAFVNGVNSKPLELSPYAGIKPLWGPHKTNHYLVVARSTHLSPSGRRIDRGYTVRFATPEYRNNWLRQQHPRAHKELK